MQDVQALPSTRKWTRSHPQTQIIGDPSESVKTRKATENETLYAGFLSEIEPKKTHEALDDPDWIQAMQEELAEFDRNEVWRLVPQPLGKSIVGTNGSSATRKMKVVLLFATRPD